MIKKILFPCIGIIIIIIATFVLYKNSHRNINQLMSQFENAINTGNKQNLINCYPNFLHAQLNELISEESINEFHIKVGDISVSDAKIGSDMDLSDVKELQTEIQNEYNADIELKDYKFIKFSYHYDFSESIMPLIKIKNKYYFYENGYLGVPVEYFIKK